MRNGIVLNRSFTNHLKEEQMDLTGPKLGLAAVMFVYVALACSLPVIVFNWMQNAERRRSTSQFNESDDNELMPRNRSNRSKWSKFRFGCGNWSLEKRERFVGRSNCLAAGALLSVGFLDVFMDTMESVDDALAKLHVNSNFPVASFTTLIGFLLILGVEQITLEHYHNPRSTVKVTKAEEHGDIQVATIRRLSSGSSGSRDLEIGLRELAEVVSNNSDTQETMIKRNVDENQQNTTDHMGHSHFRSDEVINTGWIRVMILLFAISLHSIFEGMALGLSGSLTSLLTLFAALSLHKLIIAVSIGISLATETGRPNITRGHRRKLFVYQALAVLTFAGASPLGALIGWAVTSQTDSVEFLLTQAILQGLACGTFCYVVFCELLPKEMREEKGDKAGKFFFLVLGFALVAFVIAFSPADD